MMVVPKVEQPVLMEEEDAVHKLLIEGSMV